MSIKKAPITWIILIVSVFIYLAARINGPESVRFLALIYEELPQRWYTLISYGFVHIELYHILLNMAVLFFVGSWVEKLAGKKRYLILIFLSILAGGAALAFRETGGIGFSAAGFGILFFYYLAFPWERELPFQLPNIVLPLTLLVISILAIMLGWLPAVGHYPHLAGAVVGSILVPIFKKTGNFSSV